MAKAKDYPGFETLGADIKAARQAMGLSRRFLAERVNIDPRYLANIENGGNLPSAPVLYELVKNCPFTALNFLISKPPLGAMLFCLDAYLSSRRNNIFLFPSSSMLYIDIHNIKQS